MKNELVLEQFNTFPVSLQKQVIDFMNFLSSKYIHKPINNSDDEISQDTKDLLLSRIKNHNKNPQKAVTWENIEKKYEEKYGYEI